MKNFDIGFLCWVTSVLVGLYFINVGQELIAIWMMLLYITTKLNEPKQ